MVSPLLYPYRTAASTSHPSRVLCLVPMAAGFRTVDVRALFYRDLCLYLFPSLDPGLDPCHGLLEAERRVDVYGMYNLARPASSLIPEKEDACP